MTTALLALVLAALFILSVCVTILARKVPGPELKELVRIRQEGAMADEQLTRVTADCMQAMLDAALGQRHSDE